MTRLLDVHFRRISWAPIKFLQSCNMFQFIVPLYPVGWASGYSRNHLDAERTERATRKNVSHKDSECRRFLSRERGKATALTRIIIFLIRQKSRRLSSEGARARPFVRQFAHSVYLIRATLTLTKSRYDGDESTKTGRQPANVQSFFKVNRRAADYKRWDRDSRLITLVDENP